MIYKVHHNQSINWLVMKINDTSDCDVLQTQLSYLYTWSLQWGLSFNPSKCKIISFGLSRTPQFICGTGCLAA